MSYDRRTPRGKAYIERMHELLAMPKTTNLERAHMVLAQGEPNLIALEWAQDYVSRHTTTTGESNGK